MDPLYELEMDRSLTPRPRLIPHSRFDAAQLLAWFVLLGFLSLAGAFFSTFTPGCR